MENQSIEETQQKIGRKKLYSILLNIILVIAMIILIVRVALLVLFTNIYVTGPSMFPNLKQWEAGYTRKIFDYDDIDRFDIVVVKADRFSHKEDSHWVKRVIALPGETISYELDHVNKKGMLKINGHVIEEDFITGYDNLTKDDITYSTGKILEKTLKDNEYFVMGDNRGHSTDSRVVGVIYEDEIFGVGIIIVGECSDKTSSNTCGSVKRTGFKIVGW